MTAIPRGIEVLVMKASVDPEFRRLLLEQRGQAAHEIDLELTEAEREILSSMPVKQLEKIIDNTKVESKYVKIFMGTAAMLMLAVVGLMARQFNAATTTGIQPDRVRKMQMERSGDIADANDVNDVEPDPELGDQQN